MALPAVNLDDRTFQDIVDEAKRLIPRYTPEWTNHNLSDPGRRAHRAVRLDERDGVVPGQSGARPAVRALLESGWYRTVPALRCAGRRHLLAVRRAGRDDLGAGRDAGDDGQGHRRRELGGVHHRQPAGHHPARADGGDDVRRPVCSGWWTSRTICATPAARSIASAPSTVPAIWCRETRCCWASRDRWRASRCGCRSWPWRRASASTRCGRRWPGRCGTARPGSRPTCSVTPPAGSTGRARSC